MPRRRRPRPAIAPEAAGAEQWAPVPGFERQYELSSKGRVRSLKTGRCLQIRSNGGASLYSRPLKKYVSFYPAAWLFRVFAIVRRRTQRLPPPVLELWDPDATGSGDALFDELLVKPSSVPDERKPEPVKKPPTPAPPRTFPLVAWSPGHLRECALVNAALFLRFPLPPTWSERVVASACPHVGCRAHGCPGEKCTNNASVDRYSHVYHQERWQEPTTEELVELEAELARRTKRGWKHYAQSTQKLIRRALAPLGC